MAPLRRRAILAALVAMLLTVPVAVPADARAPRHGHVTGAHISLDTRLLSKSGASAWAIDEYLAAKTSLPPLGAAFLAAERKYRVNARFLLAAALHESGWGSGFIARVKHNLFGYNAYDRDPVRYASAYRTYAANIDATARFIKDFYLTPGGRWWGGRPTLRSMQRFWSSSGTWGVNVSRVARAIRLDSLRHRRIRFAPPVVNEVIHAGGPASVRLTWTGGVLPSKVRLMAVWMPIELDSDLVAAVASRAGTAMTGANGPATMLLGDAAVGPGASRAPTAGSRPAGAAGALAVIARRARTQSHALVLTVPTPPDPGRYELQLELRDAGGGPLPEVDRVAIPSSEVRSWAARAVSYSIAPTPDGTGALVRITNTGRTTIPAVPDGSPAISNNPEIVRPLSAITLAASADRFGDGPSVVLATVPLRADLAPGDAVTVVARGIAAATGRTTSWLSASMAVLGDATWLGATSSSGAWVGVSAGPVVAVPTTTPTPSPTPTPAPTPTPTPAPTPTPSRTPQPKPPVTTMYGEHSVAIRYRGGWAQASGGGYLGGHVAWSRTPGATARFTFTGTSVSWIGPIGPTRGRALVRIDGRRVARISLWRSSFAGSAVLFRRSFRTPDRHTVTIEVLSAPGHPVVAIDAFRVRG